MKLLLVFGESLNINTSLGSNNNTFMQLDNSDIFDIALPLMNTCLPDSEIIILTLIIMLTNHQNEFSINTLNRYIHSNDTYIIDRVFVNRFWDFMLPLLKELSGISEIL